MLTRLGRWLRAAGYDVAIAFKGSADSEVFAAARNEQRVLLTRDRHFLKMSSEESNVIVLSGNTVEECAKELMSRLNINWLYRPFERCMVCNAEFVTAAKSDIESQVPADTRLTAKQFWYCPQCKKVYWTGSHTKRMLRQLKRWQGAKE